FWGDSEQSKAFAYLRTTLWTLNKTLGDGYLEVDDDRIGISAGVWVDALVFTELAETQPAEAAALYQGDFLSGFTLSDCPEFDDWQFFQTESLRQTLGKLLEKLIDQYQKQGQAEIAVPYARRLVALDALHEPAQRLLMQVYEAAGQRSAALRQYQELSELLQRELGEEPDAETTALYRSIQENRGRARHQTVTAHIPTLTTPLLAREKEIAEMTALLHDPACRLLAVIGPGGIGKTSLAIHQLADQYRDGAYFVPLAPLTSADYIIPTVADALHFTSYHQGDVYQQLRRYLTGKRMLLVMDNFEHVLDGVPVVAELLTSAPHLKILVTSRERLNLQEEWIYELHGLSYPPAAGNGAVENYGAVQLFLQAARRVRPDFVLTDADKPYVAQICRSVEGMPLGVELAAAWLQMLTCREIAQEIQRSLDFLSSSLRNLPPRHRSLRAVFDSSWERLTPVEKSTLSKISIFQGGFDRDAAYAVSQAALPVLRSLVNKSLVARHESGRYQIHELLRQFAAEKLNPEDAQEAYRRHCTYYTDFIYQREAAMKGQAQVQALDEIEADIDNLRAAWMWAVHRDLPNMRKLLNGFTLFYIMRGRYQESQEMFSGTLEYLKQLSLSPEEQLLRARIQIFLACIYLNVSQVEKARALYAECYQTIQVDQTPDNAMFLVLLVLTLTWPHYNAEAEKWAQKALALFEAAHDRWGVATALRTLGDVAHTGIRYADSRRYYQQSYEVSRVIGDQWGESNALRALGEVAYTLGEYAEAERLYREGLRLSEQVGDHAVIPYVLNRLANLILLQGRYEESARIFWEGVQEARRLGDPTSMGWAWFGLGDIAITQQRYEEGMALLEDALAAYLLNESRQDPAWVYVTMSWVEILRADSSQAKTYAQQGLEIFTDVGSLWGQSAAFYCLGEAALLENDLPLARQHFKTSLSQAAQANSIMLLIRHLVGWGKLLLKEGQPQQAAEVFDFILHHQATWFEIRVRVQQHLSTLTGQPAVLPTVFEVNHDYEAIFKKCHVKDVPFIPLLS
ncbi:MAG: tetratricopeptide repeat protein, partial [Anaerolineae bacterium]|nr:tetratricopeptide repeat protein [Anaerolineae bacterium]